MRFLCIIILFISFFKAQSQTIYTEVFQGFTPAPLLELDNYLYVGTFANASEPAQIFRVPIDNPTIMELVSDFSGPSSGVWKMTYDPAQNSLLVYNLIGLYKIDLNQSLPIIPEEIIDQLAFCSGGITQKDGIVYIACANEISIVDSNASNPVLELFFTLPAGDDPFNPIFYGNELYFSTRNNGDFDLYKLNINDPAGTYELVSNLNQNTGGIQSSLIAVSFLYLGVEGTTHRVLKLDLTNPNLPIEEEVLIDNFSGAAIGLARNGNRIFITDGFTQNIWEYTDTTLGNNDFIQTSFQLSPNPTMGTLLLKGNVNVNTHYTIYGIGGEKLLHGNYTSDGIDTSLLNSGVYFIQILTDGIVQTEKFIKN